MTLEIIWTSKSYEDILVIHNYLSENFSPNIAEKVIDKIYNTPNDILFPEQFQIDQYRKDCRRIIVGSYKVLYYSSLNTIYIIRVFNSLQHPNKIF